VTNLFGLTPLEVASGYVLGDEPDVPDLPAAPRHATIREALEAAVLRALQRPPCIVAFSGGRDSCAMLALAADLAGREGLPLPIAMTYRFPADETDEASWQERVIRDVAVEDWVRRDFDDELDLLGPIACAGLSRNGMLWPFNAHFLVPAQEAAGAGSVLTGHGGDQVLHPGPHAHLARVLALRERPVPRDAARLLLAAAPARLRELRRRPDADVVDCPWLRAEAVDAVRRAYVRDQAAEPIARARWVRWMWQLRANQVNLGSMELLARDSAAQIVHPFFDPTFLAVFAETTRRRPVRNRSTAMIDLFGDLLPREVCERRGKATFSAAFWSRHSREFARTITADDVDSEIVDGERAVAFWNGPESETGAAARSGSLLQSCWLARQERLIGKPREQGLAGGIESVPVARTA
jgi:asparagine synthetase B (glutamine-hydrolysing)